MPAAARIVQNVDPNKLSAVCGALKCWDIRRRNSWATVTRKVPGRTSSVKPAHLPDHRTSAGKSRADADRSDERDPGNPLSGILPEAGVICSSGASPKKPDEWLSMVEIAPYRDGSRKLWMGPQFQFEQRGALPDATLPTTQPLGETNARPCEAEGAVAIPAFRLAGDPELQVAASSWPNPPVVTFPATELPGPDRDALVISALQEAIASETIAGNPDHARLEGRPDETGNVFATGDATPSSPASPRPGSPNDDDGIFQLDLT